MHRPLNGNSFPRKKTKPLLTLFLASPRAELFLPPPCVATASPYPASASFPVLNREGARWEKLPWLYVLAPKKFFPFFTPLHPLFFSHRYVFSAAIGSTMKLFLFRVHQCLATPFFLPMSPPSLEILPSSQKVRAATSIY